MTSTTLKSIHSQLVSLFNEIQTNITTLQSDCATVGGAIATQWVVAKTRTGLGLDWGKIA